MFYPFDSARGPSFKWAPVAGAFDAAVDMGPSIPPRLPVPA